jgi:hypothetical protein
MENQNKLSLNDLAISALRESAKWCMFLAIVGFIFIGLMVLGGVFMTIGMSAISSMSNDSYGQMGMNNPFMVIKNYIGLIYLVFALLYFFPVFYLFKYAKGIKDALSSGNEVILANALANLKSHHKFLGIMTIIMIALYIIVIIGAVVFAAKMASAGM